MAWEMEEGTYDDKDREDEETHGNAVLCEGGGRSRTDEDNVTSPIPVSAPLPYQNRTKGYSQANQREDHDGLVSPPQGISEDTTENGSDINEEGVELGKRSTIRFDGYHIEARPLLTVLSAKLVG